METYLKGLLTPTSTARNPHEAAIQLQREYEELVGKESEIKTGASKGKSTHLKVHKIVNLIIINIPFYI